MDIQLRKYKDGWQVNDSNICICPGGIDRKRSPKWFILIDDRSNPSFVNGAIVFRGESKEEMVEGLQEVFNAHQKITDLLKEGV